MSVLWVKNNRSGVLWLRKGLIKLVGKITKIVIAFSKRKIGVD